MSESGYVMEKVFQETTRRFDDENKRQNERITNLENSYKIVKK